MRVRIESKPKDGRRFADPSDTRAFNAETGELIPFRSAVIELSVHSVPSATIEVLGPEVEFEGEATLVTSSQEALAKEKRATLHWMSSTARALADLQAANERIAELEARGIPS